MNNVIENIYTRRSIRKYSDKKVEKEKIETILKAAMQAPSARNQQPWIMYVEEKKEVLEECSKSFRNITFAKDASFAIVFLADKNSFLVESMFSQDMSSAVTVAMLAARSLGVGSCWCGIYPVEERMELVKKVFNLKNDYIPFAVVTFGYPLSEDDFKYCDRFNEKKILSGDNDA